MFITFEGVEGCGKSAVLDKLTNKFFRNNRPHIVTRSLTDSHVGERLRALLENHKVLPASELLITFAAQLEHINKVIEPALRDGITVLSDDYLDDIIVKFGVIEGLDVTSLLQYVGLLPNLTFYLRISSDLALERMAVARPEQDWQRLIAGYDSLAVELRDRFIVIDADNTIDAIVDQVWQFIEDEANWPPDKPRRVSHESSQE